MVQDIATLKWFCHPLYDVGNAWGVLRGKTPKITRAEAMARAELAWELIYKQGATLKGDNPLKLYLGPLTLLSLDSPSLTLPCYNMMTESTTKGICVHQSWKQSIIYNKKMSALYKRKDK